MQSSDPGETTKSSDSFSCKVPESLLQLSSDLKIMFENQFMSDLTLCIGGKVIQCHRAILSFRSRWFASRICQQDAYGITEPIIINENEQIMDALLVYIYTGNLRLVESLKVPILNLHDAATLYGLDRLKKILTKVIKSERKTGLTKTIELLWKIKVSDSMNAESTCPGLKGFSLDGTDKWCLKMKTVLINGEKYGFGIYIVRQSKSNENRTHIVSLDLHLMDKAGKRRLSFSNDFIIRNDGESKMPENISLCKLLRNANFILPKNVLTMTCQLKVSAEDFSNPMLFEIKDSHERALTNELHALSYDMYQLLRSQKFCDVTIHCRGSATFKAHSSLLYARSKIPIAFMSCLADVGSFGSIVWKSFIYFLYTGQERYLEDHMREVYFSACTLQIEETKQKYSKILETHLTTENVSAIVSEATYFKDKDLVYAGLLFIAEAEIINQPSWSQLSRAHPDFARAIMHMTRHKKTRSCQGD